jgi:hypothetical protein
MKYMNTRKQIYIHTHKYILTHIMAAQIFPWQLAISVLFRKLDVFPALVLMQEIKSLIFIIHHSITVKHLPH